ncbi:hypothetical protein ACFYZB_04150 [Streptomyces sp. NPDC001852]|uniref:hypothetical protein n=1 Tax=Streptomyces sp. NPDC001852 TaxID=3364619 RepID=UPI0036A2A0D8
MSDPNLSANRRSRKSSERFAALAGSTSGRTVERMRTVNRYAPDLAPKVAAGEMSAHAAYQEARRRALEASAAGVDLGPRARVGGRLDAPDTEPCPHCRGTGRRRKETP